jgi:hypothetical protein
MVYVIEVGRQLSSRNRMELQRNCPKLVEFHARINL